MVFIKKLGYVLLERFDEISEFSEEVFRVVGPRSSFRVMLHGENRVLGAADAFDRMVVEINMSDFSVIGQGGIIGGKTMVLRCNGNLAGAKIFNRVVSSAVSEFQFESPSTKAMREDLVAQTNTEDGLLADQLFDFFMNV